MGQGYLAAPGQTRAKFRDDRLYQDGICQAGKRRRDGTRDCPRAAFPFLGFSATLPTPGLGGRVAAACQLAVGVEACLL